MRIPPPTQRSIGENSLQRNRKSHLERLHDLSWNPITLLVVDERVGEIENVFVTVNVGHSGRRVEDRRRTMKVSTEDDEDNQPQSPS